MWKNLGRGFNLWSLKHPIGGFAGIGAGAGAVLGGVGGLFSRDTSVFGGMARGAIAGAGMVGLGYGGLRAWKRFGPRVGMFANQGAGRIRGLFL